MSRHFSLKIALVSLLLFTVCGGAALAGSNGWSYGNYNNGSYVPLSGSFTETNISTTVYRTWVSFSFDNHNRTNILDYNNGGNNPGSFCDNVNAYVTVDVTSVAVYDPLDAYVIYTNLPNPKTDLESDVGTPNNEESETVALGTVSSGTNYYMRTYWNDERNCGAGNNGNIQVQFSMSNKPWWSNDYNNCVTSGAVQVINSYGACQGTL